MSTNTTSNPAIRRIVHSSATDDWATPQAMFDKLDQEFGFVLDVCANRENHKTPAWYGLDHPLLARRNGLVMNWAAEASSIDPRGAVWMNPPYGRGLGAWMLKAQDAAERGATVVGLVPARTDTRWFHEHVLGARAQIRFVPGRVKFGKATHGAPFPSLIVVYRPTPAVGVAA